MSNRYNKRTLVHVTPFTGAVIKYGFNTNADDAKRTALGHEAVDLNNLPIGLVLGANQPKPGKARKLFATGNVSSFYDITKAGTLKSDGWKLSFPTIRRGRTTPKAACHYVTIGGINYAWMMPNETGIKIGEADKTALGIKTGTANDRDLVWGASYPQPPRASTRSGDNIISTYVDPSKIDSLPEGWMSSGREQVTGAAA